MSSTLGWLLRHRVIYNYIEVDHDNIVLKKNITVYLIEFNHYHACLAMCNFLLLQKKFMCIINITENKAQHHLSISQLSAIHSPS